jgi:hypothetical protein
MICIGQRLARDEYKDWRRRNRGREIRYQVETQLSRDVLPSDLELATECPICVNEFRVEDDP